jgi:hypothetical protein
MLKWLSLIFLVLLLALAVCSGSNSKTSLNETVCGVFFKKNGQYVSDL